MESSPVKLDHGNLASITASLGVAEVERTFEGALENLVSETINRADRAMYQAKAAGRNRVKAALSGEYNTTGQLIPA